MTLDELFSMKAGQHISSGSIAPSMSESRLVPCYGGNGVRGFVEAPSHDGEFLLIGRQGALCGNVQRVRGPFYATEHAVVTAPRSAVVDLNWAFHLLSAMNLNQYATKSAQPGLAVGNLLPLRVPVPSLEFQVRTASILDRFDTLVNDLSIGLPAELKARRLQYEHYRDRLLTFREAA